MNDVSEPQGGLERLLLPDEVAALLGVPKSWVYDAVRRDKIPHVSVGRYIRFRRIDLERWISEGGTPADHEQV